MISCSKDPRPHIFFSPFRRPPTPLSVVRLVVSMDGDQYTVVDVTGALDGAWIRQRIFTKVGGTVLHYKNTELFANYSSSCLLMSKHMVISQYIHQKLVLTPLGVR